MRRSDVEVLIGRIGGVLLEHVFSLLELVLLLSDLLLSEWVGWGWTGSSFLWQLRLVLMVVLYWWVAGVDFSHNLLGGILGNNTNTRQSRNR